MVAADELKPAIDLASLGEKIDAVTFRVRTLLAERLAQEYPDGHAERHTKVPKWAIHHLTLCQPGRCTCGRREACLPREERNGSKEVVEE